MRGWAPLRDQTAAYPMRRTPRHSDGLNLHVEFLRIHRRRLAEIGLRERQGGMLYGFIKGWAAPSRMMRRD